MTLLNYTNTKNINTHQQMSKEGHIKEIINLIRDKNINTRTGIAKMMAISSPAVFTLVDYMVSKGILIQKGTDESTNSGRKPLVLELNANYLQIATIDVHKHYVKFVLYDLFCKETENITLNVENNNYINTVREIVNNRSKKLDFKKLSAISIGLPAVVGENAEGFLSTVININEDKTKQNNLITAFKNMFEGYNLIIGNQTAFCAYGEKIKTDCLIYIYYGYGIGAGIIINGDIFKGADGMAGEIGHMSIDCNGPVCKCGSRGCLEQMINIPAILSKINIEIKKGGYSIVADTNTDTLTIHDVANAFKQKDKLVLDVMDDVCEKFAFGLNNIINLYNPGEIIIGGDISVMGEEFLKTVLGKIALPIVKALNKKVSISYSNAGDNGANYGAAKYILNNIIVWSKEQ